MAHHLHSGVTILHISAIYVGVPGLQVPTRVCIPSAVILHTHWTVNSWQLVVDRWHTNWKRHL